MQCKQFCAVRMHRTFDRRSVSRSRAFSFSAVGRRTRQWHVFPGGRAPFPRRGLQVSESGTTGQTPTTRRTERQLSIERI